MKLPQLGPILRPTVWQRRHLWLWNAANDQKTTKEELALAAGLGFDAIVVKVHDGASVFHGPEGENSDPAFFAYLRRFFRVVGGWGWLTGDGVDGLNAGGAEAEAERAAERVRALGLDLYVADPEVFYEYGSVDWPVKGAGRLRFACSARFVRTFAKAIGKPGFPRGVTSYGRVDLHSLDWHSWAGPGPDRSVWRWIPQAYWNESPALSPELCVAAGARFWRPALIHPLLGCYRGAVGTVTADTYAGSLRRARTVGFGCYDADTMEPAERAAFGRVPVRG